ncbi:MAG: Na(+)-translocating NADH-quinone reductase subunit C [Bacteroidota bacterium]|nr:Na(+)-translocating NADH-quinone reductase subunit C [Bacteroidota bacterium]
MNTESNSYTFLFAAAMVFVVASTLAFTASSLKKKQDENVRKEKMQSILKTIGVDTSRDGAEELYNKYIKEELSIDQKGNVDNSVSAFSIKLIREIKKPISEQRFPVFIAETEGNKYYIIPLRGAGLWDAIWGYVALRNDKKTIEGIIFDHKAETAGLGAEITQQWFQDRFKEEKIFNHEGSLVGINVSKTNNDPKNLDKDDHEVDAISGATITGDGVSNMILERIGHYLPYFNKLDL